MKFFHSSIKVSSFRRTEEKKEEAKERRREEKKEGPILNYGMWNHKTSYVPPAIVEIFNYWIVMIVHRQSSLFCQNSHSLPLWMTQRPTRVRGNWSQHASSGASRELLPWQSTVLLDFSWELLDDSSFLTNTSLIKLTWPEAKNKFFRMLIKWHFTLGVVMYW